MVWDPRKITRRTWAEAELFYRNLEDRNPDFRPLRELVEHVVRQAYAAALGPATSGTALLVAPLAAADLAVEALRVDVDLSGGVRLSAPGAAEKASDPVASDRLLPAAFERAAARAGWIPRT